MSDPYCHWPLFLFMNIFADFHVFILRILQCLLSLTVQYCTVAGSLYNCFHLIKAPRRQPLVYKARGAGLQGVTDPGEVDARLRIRHSITEKN